MKPYFKITRRGQVYYICGWKDIVKRNISVAHKLIQNILKEMRETMSLEWIEQDKDFGIDNVIMNPPYNNDMYIDFVELAQNVAKEIVVAITPAKWQAKGGEKNDNFRENIVPYIKEIVYYPDCIQVFGISENSGITYFRLDKDRHIKKEICNKAYFQPLINSKIERELNTNDTLWNYGQAIINKIQEKNERRFKLEYIQEDSRKRYTICVGKQWCGSRLSSGAWDMNTSQIKKEYIGKGGCIFNPNGTIKVLGKVVCLKGDESDTSNSSICIFTSDNEEKAISFYSFINTKLFSFLILINLKGSIIFDDLTLKYIPDPGEFDHIFTDEELYKKYNLTNEEINIIESVIKDRK